MAAVFSVVEYRWTLRYLWSGGFAPIAGMTKEGKEDTASRDVDRLVRDRHLRLLRVLLRLV